MDRGWAAYGAARGARLLALSSFSGPSAFKTRIFLRRNERMSSTVGLVVSENRGKGKNRAITFTRRSR